MSLTRTDALDLSTAELHCLTNHISNLSNICEDGGMLELRHGIEQLRAAVYRIGNDIAAVRAARIQ